MTVRLHSLIACVLLLSCLCVAERGSVQDMETTPVQWTEMPWGELGVAQMQYAPFPDDSRTTGYANKQELFPYEGHYDDSSTAFVIPDGFRKSESVALVVICHGHRNNCTKFVEQATLGPLLKQSGRNAIIVAPQGPKEAPDSSGGKFEKPGVFAKFVNEAVEVLKKEKRIAPDAKLGTVILAGFSGGYRPVGKALDVGGANELIREVWLIDAAYAFEKEIAAPFAGGDESKALRSIFTEHLAAENHSIMSYICKEGKARVALVDDDLITTPGSTGPDKTDELPILLKREKLLFIPTNLPHDAFLMSHRFVGAFLENSKYLEKR